MGEARDRDLANQAAAGDGAAFAALVERHYDRIYRTAWRLVGNRAEAEDTAQEVCVKLATAIRGWRGDAELTTWLWRITWNAATDVLRARQRTRSLPPSEMMMLAEGADPRSAEDAVEGHELWAAVRGLPAQQRDAVLLVYGEDMSHAEAATVMGCSEKTVSWHLHAARKRLKTILEAVA